MIGSEIAQVRLRFVHKGSYLMKEQGLVYMCRVLWA